ncbi:FGGY-family carbohydrate kinase [Spirosoma rhododendri]|uniref:Carbohydrate kinase n=1 Tax=Spirosoma rhododendri TaxID=2728024 RepID=A0A7L5DKM6_9BACT|nr:FGGY family carbohydrate kinase [Spirosoma rhododendri]QJD78062.1 carbohydrate kinase [Spirosoma rhododendri]
MHVAVFDIGKTNKKLFLFDRQYNIVWETSTQFVETVDEDGDPCEDVDHLTNWVQQALQDVLAKPQFDVKALNFSTYGASLVCVDAQGQAVGPLYNYLKAYPDELSRQFYLAYGPEERVSVETASPALGNLNSGLALYRIRHQKPDLFARMRYALHLPQYVSSLFTGQFHADLTSIGCHTALWNFDRQQYHGWVTAEQLDQKLAPLFPGNAVMDTVVYGKPMKVGVGLHDSSAALIPYLASFSEPFVLISTGTWCISLNPFNTQPLTAEELQYDCLCFLNYQGQPVKASRLFAGYEHEQQVQRLAAHFGVPVDTYKQVPYDPSLIDELPTRPVQPIPDPLTTKQPAVLVQSAFIRRDLTDFDTYEQAYHQLIHDIVAQQLISTELVLHRSPVDRIFVDGGFSKNPIYMALLASAFPQLNVSAASVAQATALGAALAIHDNWNPLPLPDNLVQLRPVDAPMHKPA